jgi:glycosyltransferase involved in cell wall biosynthesis
LRLLWLTETYFPSRGGTAQSCDRIVHALRRAGVTVDVVHCSPRYQHLTVTTKQHGRHLACPTGTDTAHSLNCLWNVLAADPHRPAWTHVVAFGGTLPLLAAPIYAAWLDLPLVTLLRGNDFDTAVFTPRRGDVLRDALERAARVCVVTQEHAWKITALYPAVRPVWIPNGIDLTEWAVLPSHRQRAAAWRRQHVEPGRRLLGMIGQIKQKKGGLFFLEALLASGCAARFHLLLVGDIGDEMVEWLQAHEAAVAYTRYPFVDRADLLAYYPVCDLVAIPSFYDGLPNVLLEAAGLGVPLLASSAGGMADLLVDGQHGFVFYPGDARDCQRAIRQAAAASGEELHRLGEACRSMVTTRLSAEREAEAYLTMFTDLLAERQSNHYVPDRNRRS